MGASIDAIGVPFVNGCSLSGQDGCGPICVEAIGVPTEIAVVDCLCWLVGVGVVDQCTSVYFIIAESGTADQWNYTSV